MARSTAAAIRYLRFIASSVDTKHVLQRFAKVLVFLLAVRRPGCLIRRFAEHTFERRTAGFEVLQDAIHQTFDIRLVMQMAPGPRDVERHTDVEFFMRD